MLVSCVTHLWARTTDSRPNTKKADGCIITNGAGFTLNWGSDVKSGRGKTPLIMKTTLVWKVFSDWRGHLWDFIIECMAHFDRVGAAEAQATLYLWSTASLRTATPAVTVMAPPPST